MAGCGLLGVIATTLVVCMVVSPCVATVYTVGDSSGWAIGVDYSIWATDKTFNVGDTLVFNYGGEDTVDEVNGSDYKTCRVGEAITTDSSGSTSIELKTPGTHYFISAVTGHCESGMKLALYVDPGTTTNTSTTPSSESSYITRAIYNSIFSGGLMGVQ
ncbi:blue copper protein-like [Euphorbia lathyris]|uniref:blue copper protein-like n=1 Tax=Euphorbia lathyris TaxID=212925 RepID=UPI003313580B